MPGFGTALHLWHFRAPGFGVGFGAGFGVVSVGFGVGFCVGLVVGFGVGFGVGFVVGFGEGFGVDGKEGSSGILLDKHTHEQLVLVTFNRGTRSSAWGETTLMRPI